ncbi:chromobox protein homolog 1-like [Sitodiplosis mosellana]|uniref:chromobox protein homolog 1-like n=1 Tax=Sitodiplosis mosellana TaxID=263140 RepID=UPI002444D3D9|nr:chromobox protein homolog 1-like [Sitodiplosis mosellana]
MNSSTDSASSEIDYEVERVDGKKVINGVIHYNIKWKNYPVAENTWEPIANLSCAELINEFEHAQKRRGSKPKLKSNHEVNGNDVMKSPGDLHQSKMTDFVYNTDNLVRINDMKRISGEVMFLVEFKGMDEEEWVPVNIIKRNYPQKVIKFYEECITWIK